MPEPDQITLTLPPERDYHRIAHLVLGGLALRLELTLETLEDLQLALSAILDRVPETGDVTVSMSLSNGTLQTSVEPVDLADEFARDGEDALGLRRILSTVTDDVEFEGSRVRLTKKVERARG